MNVYKNVCAAAAIALLVAGCSSNNASRVAETLDGEAPVQTVDYYKTHAAERKAMQATCHNNPGELRGTPNCKNAAAAESVVEFSGTGYGTDNLVPVPAPAPAPKPKH
jgi:hypothetical protein